jgi:tetratricopeptide (TPR) repeat protein
MRHLTLLLMLLLPLSASLDEAIHLYEKGEFKQAINVLLQLKGTSLDNPDVRLWLGKSFLKVRDWDGAVREMEKMVQMQPSSQNHLWLGRAYGAKASHVVFFSAPRWARRVLKEFETARTLSPDNLDARFDLLEYYLEAPGFLGGGKDKANAEAQAIAKQDAMKGHLARSIILSKDKKWDLAEKERIQATIDYPNHAAAFKDLADFLFDRQDYGGALQTSRKALALDKESKGSQLIVAAASVRLRTGLEESGRILYALASGPLTDNDPFFEEVYYWLGEYYLAKGDKAKAKEAFGKALVFNPEYDRAKAKI